MKIPQDDGSQVFPQIQLSATFPRNSCRGAVDASCPNILNVGVISGRNSSDIIFLRCVFVPLFLIYCCCNPVLMTSYSRIMVKGLHNFHGRLETNSIHLPHWQWQVLVWTDLRLLSPWQRPSFCRCFCPNCLLVVVALGSLLKVITLLDYCGFAWISSEAYSTLPIYRICPSQRSQFFWINFWKKRFPGSPWPDHVNHLFDGCVASMVVLVV